MADAYRREIDAEENLWRTLPFFAATLALQLAALFQIIDKLPEPGSVLGRMAAGCLISCASSTLNGQAGKRPAAARAPDGRGHQGLVGHAN